MGKKRGGGIPVCWQCGSKGHVQTQCESVLSGSAVKSCFVCSSTDHIAPDCPLKVADVKKPQGPWVKHIIGIDNSETANCPRMTVVITTSPVPSNPSTMMIQAVINSFRRVDGLKDCPLIIVCDGFRFSEKSTWKAGKVTEDAAMRYQQYLENLEGLLHSGWLPSGTRLVVLDGRNGQALAVKAGLAQVSTPFVLVHQHDLEFTFDFKLDTVLDVLEDESNNVKYVGMPLLTNLHYEGIAWQHHGVRVKPESYLSINLVPIIFWYDSTHITSVQHYNSLVFGPAERYAAGDFVEETFGVRQRNDIIAKGTEVHSKYGTYHCLSHAIDGSRRPLICHLNGVRFLTPEQRAERGFPADPPVEFFPSRTMMNRKQRKVRHILDCIIGFSALRQDDCEAVKNVLSKLLNETRIRCSAPASSCLPV